MAATDKKQFILEHTRTLLMERGAAGLTMRKVAEQCGMSLGNLQYHFTNRQVLLQGVLDSFLLDYECSLTELTAQSEQSLSQQLEHLFMTVFLHPELKACGKVFKELWAQSQHQQSMQQAMDAYYQRLSSFYAEFLAQLTGLQKQDNKIQLAVALLVPLLEGYCVTGNVSQFSDQQLAQSWASTVISLLNP